MRKVEEGVCCLWLLLNPFDFMTLVVSHHGDVYTWSEICVGERDLMCMVWSNHCKVSHLKQNGFHFSKFWRRRCSEIEAHICELLGGVKESRDFFFLVSIVWPNSSSDSRDRGAENRNKAKQLKHWFLSDKYCGLIVIFMRELNLVKFHAHICKKSQCNIYVNNIYWVLSMYTVSTV